MTEHVHEWRRWGEDFRCQICRRIMYWREVMHRLNATERLMRMSNEDIAAELSATFDLNLEDTRQIADWILEGTDE